MEFFDPGRDRLDFFVVLLALVKDGMKQPNHPTVAAIHKPMATQRLQASGHLNALGHYFVQDFGGLPLDDAQQVFYVAFMSLNLFFRRCINAKRGIIKMSKVLTNFEEALLSEILLPYIF